MKDKSRKVGTRRHERLARQAIAARVVSLSCVLACLTCAGLLCAAVLSGCSEAGEPHAQTVVISFRGGDAEAGEVAPIEAEVGSTIELPENGFTWEGHEFVGWVSGHDEDGTPLEAGTEVVVEDETVYTARWREVGSSAAKAIDWDYESTWVELEVREGDEELVGTMGGWGGKERGGLLLVKNGTSHPIDLVAKLTFVQRSGHDWLTNEADAFTVGPDELALFHATDLHRSDGLRWRIEVRESADWAQPLGDDVEVAETTVTADQLVVRLTNNGDHLAQIYGVRLIATKKDGSRYAGDAFTTGSLEPGQSMEVTFTKDNMFDFDAFPSFADAELDYIVEGSMNLNKTTAGGSDEP